MVFNSIQWYSMVFDGIQWYLMVFDGIQWYWLVFHGCPVIQQQYQNIFKFDVQDVEQSDLLCVALD